MTLDELCAEVNRILREQEISVTDGRTATVVTPRHIRFYKSLGMSSPPKRSEGRAIYDQSHIDEIVAIKKAQSEGISLEQLKRLKKSIEISSATQSNEDFGPVFQLLAQKTSRTDAPSAKYELRVTGAMSRPSQPQRGGLSNRPVMGWSIRIDDITISGSGTAPSAEQIARITQVLSGDPT